MRIGRHRATTSPGTEMHTDDKVAPGVTRIRAAWVTGAGIAIIVISLVLYVQIQTTATQRAQSSASLSQEEVKALRGFLVERGKQRDSERAEVQQQLDRQAKALCGALSGFEVGARPETIARLKAAEKSIGCDVLARTGTLDLDPAAPASTSSATDRPITATPTGAAVDSGDAQPPPAPPGAVPAPTSTPGTVPAPARTVTTPGPVRTVIRPGPVVTTSGPTVTTTASPSPRILDPVTQPVCDLLGICL